MLTLFSITIFLSAALLFLVQPMFAKMVLPMLGGTPAVWNTCMVFFQAALLGGYVYAHATIGWLGVRRQAWIHLVLLLIGLSTLPIAIPSDWSPPVENNPMQWLLLLLSVAVGLPFFLISASGPMLQKWFSSTQHRDAEDPYFLYAASNVGSLSALLAYPALLEPSLRLAAQSTVWTYGYTLLIFLTLVCAMSLWRSHPSTQPMETHTGRGLANGRAIATDTIRPTVPQRMRWVVLSFVPSSLMLGVTTYISTDIAAFPLLWVIPLAIYLLTFVLVFSRMPILSHAFLVRRLPFLILASMITIFTNATHPGWLLIPLHLITFFVATMVCHGELAKERPPAKYLTEFYLALSVGGVLGGIFNALAAPLIFKTVAEYPLAMVLAALMRPSLRANEPKSLSRWLDFGFPIVLALVAITLVVSVQNSTLKYGRLQQLIVFGVSGIICLSFGYRSVRFGLGVAALMIASTFYTGPYGRVLHADRSFFGIHRVILDGGEDYKLLFHGSTIHGAQSLDPSRRSEPLTYFYRDGPVGQIFAAREWREASSRVAVIGLGAGSMLCHGEAGQRFTFYEIDPIVERIARDPRHFSFLTDCSAEFEVVLGDARLSLLRAPDAYYGLIVLDAFSSDAIPLHLLTREALRLYLAKLVDGGILAFHISNRHLDLKPVVADLARDAGLISFVQEDLKINEADRAKRKAASIWAVLGRRRSELDAFGRDSRWKRLEGKSGGRVWSDDFSNVLSVFKWP